VTCPEKKNQIFSFSPASFVFFGCKLTFSYPIIDPITIIPSPKNPTRKPTLPVINFSNLHGAFKGSPQLRAAHFKTSKNKPFSIRP